MVLTKVTKNGILNYEPEPITAYEAKSISFITGIIKILGKKVLNSTVTVMPYSCYKCTKDRIRLNIYRYNKYIFILLT